MLQSRVGFDHWSPRSAATRSAATSTQQCVRYTTQNHLREKGPKKKKKKTFDTYENQKGFFHETKYHINESNQIKAWTPCGGPVLGAGGNRIPKAAPLRRETQTRNLVSALATSAPKI